MKRVKKSSRRNFIICADFYNQKEFTKLMGRNDVFTTAEYGVRSDEIGITNYFHGTAELRISAESVNEIKVTYSKDLDMYYNVVVTNDGEEIAIEL